MDEKSSTPSVHSEIIIFLKIVKSADYKTSRPICITLHLRNYVKGTFKAIA